MKAPTPPPLADLSLRTWRHLNWRWAYPEPYATVGRRLMARLDTPKTPLGYDGAWGRCEQCGKIAWPSRKAARNHVRNHHRRGDPQQAYRCPYGLGWHLGHLPPAVRRGEYDRGTYAARAVTRTLKGSPNDRDQD